MNVLITGANGFIGRALCSRLASDNKVIGVYYRNEPVNANNNIVWEQADPPASLERERWRAGLTDYNSAAAICVKYSPAVVVHCAGVAHQKIGAVDSSTYMRVNSEDTENLAKAASKGNPAVRFIFLSSVSVYGEDNLNMPVSEDSKCQPSSDYALSKLDAEQRLIALADKCIINNLIILRLAPVYDRDWSFNLDRRVLAPGKLTYLRFGSGSQRMSALARPNLVDFIKALTESKLAADAHGHMGHRKEENTGVNIFNVCDAKAYGFNKIIQVFKKSGMRPNRPVIPVPLPVVWLATRIAGSLLHHRRKWLHSCYDKLASSLVFDNEKMLKTGFEPVHSLETIFDPQIKYLTQRRKDAKIKKKS